MTDFLKVNNKNIKINEVEDYTWKLEKYIDENGVLVQNSIKLIDASEEQLRKFINHCNSMLYNKNNPKDPGRCVLLINVKNQIDKCNAELFRRELGPAYSNLTLSILMKFIENNDVNMNLTTLSDADIYDNVPENLLEYMSVSVSDAIDSLKGKLGEFNRKPLTLTFLMKQEIWLADDEKEEMNKFLLQNPNKTKSDYVKSYLKLPEGIKIRFSPRGLSLSKMKSLLSLSNKVLYSSMTDEQLILLKNRVLYDLIDEIQHHIKNWEERISQIKEVAKIKGYKL